MLVRPEHISLNDWAGSLFVDYPKESWPILTNETDWKEWGTIVANTGLFEIISVPTPFTIKEGQKKENFPDWQAWATAVYLVINSDLSLESQFNV